MYLQELSKSKERSQKLEIYLLISTSSATYQVCVCALDIGVHGMWKSQETFENLSPPSLDQQTLPFLRLKNTKVAIFIKSFCRKLQ